MIHLLSPGTADQRTGGYRYNARLVEELRGRGRAVTVHELDGDWPNPNAAALRAATQRVEALRGVVIADGLLWTGLASHVSRPVVAIVHSPLWREHGAAVRAPEEAALRRAAQVVCTSRRTAADLQIASPLTIVVPGTDSAPRARRPGRGRLLCVANVIERKGHDVLIEAVRRLRVPVTLRCVGSLDRDSAFAERVMAASADLPVAWVGSLDPADVDTELAQADVLVSAARYEGYGMAIAEGWMRGLPVVSPPAGILDGREGGHVLVPPDDPERLAEALDRLVREPSVAEALSEEARGMALPSWADQAEAWLAVLGATQ